MEIEQLKSNSTKSRDNLLKLTKTKHESTQHPTIIDLDGIMHKLSRTGMDDYYSSLTLNLVITTDSNSFDNDNFIAQFIAKFKGFNKNQIKIKSIHKESSVINISNIITRINLNLKYDHCYRTNINAITNLLSSISAFSLINLKDISH